MDQQTPKGMTTYPGEGAMPEEIILLANEYRDAALHLQAKQKEGKAKREMLQRAPYRLLAIHAVELYLNAFLLMSGYSAKEVRGFQHDFETRVRLARDKKLVLRQKTYDHIVSLNSSREYLTSRYAPEMTTRQSEVTRLNATLIELSKRLSIQKTPIKPKK